MSPLHVLSSLLDPQRPLRLGEDGIWSEYPEDTAGTAYDARALLYDRALTLRAYTIGAWGVHPRRYRQFAAASVRDGDGPLLDIGCGSALYTADVYRTAPRPVVLLDRSRAMLRRAAERLGDTDGLALVHADLFDLPFRPGAFGGVASHGVLHFLPETDRALAALAAQVRPGGCLHVSSIVVGRLGSDAYHRGLERLGHMAEPRTPDQIDVGLHRAGIGVIDRAQIGSMQFVRGRRARRG